MKVCSYSFFRHKASAYEHPNCGEAQGRFFVNYLPTIIRAHHHVWKGWEMVIHHDDTAREFPYFKVLEKMQERNLIKLVYCGGAITLCGSMLWRLHPLFEESVEYVVCRDVDSLPMPRDEMMVREFMLSGTMIHTIHDSISHCGLMGGMCSFNAKTFRVRTGHKDLASLMCAGNWLGLDYNSHGDDQRFLNAVIYSGLAPYTFIHSNRNLGYLAHTTKQVIGRLCPEDMLANHIGGCFDAAAARNWYDANHPNQEILACEK